MAVFVLSLRLLPESRDEEAHRSFDVAGAVSITAGLMTLVYAIVQAGEHGWTSARTIGLFVLAGVLHVAFVIIEQRSKAPLVRLSILRVRSLRGANVTMFLVASGLFAMFFFNTLYIQRVLGYGPLEAGLAFLPFTAGIMVSAGFASKFTPRLGVRPVAIGGMIVTIAGMMLLTRISVDGSYASDVLPALVLTALGLGAVFVPLTLVATTGLKNEDQGLASGSSTRRSRSAARSVLRSSRRWPRTRPRARPASRSRRPSWTASTSRSRAVRPSWSSRSAASSRCSARRDVERIDAEAATVPIS